MDNGIKELADYIGGNIPGEPSNSEGACDVAVRLLKKYRFALSGIKNRMNYPEEPCTDKELATDALGLEIPTSSPPQKG